MKKVFNGNEKVFEEGDVGKRFDMLKDQMTVQENSGEGKPINGSALSAETHNVQPTDPAGPVSGGYLKRK